MAALFLRQPFYMKKNSPAAQGLETSESRIMIEGRMQLDIRSLNPKYVKRWW